MRRCLPDGVKMYTGDDFNYPGLIGGDDQGFSHALPGIFGPLAPASAYAVSKLSEGDAATFRATPGSTVPMAQQIFRFPAQHYSTGIMFPAWLNGFQKPFHCVDRRTSSAALPDFIMPFGQADECGLLRDCEMAVARMKGLSGFYGVT